MDLLILSTHITYNNHILVYDAVLSCKLLLNMLSFPLESQLIQQPENIVVAVDHNF